jgi:Protein of unknown function, DUF547
MNAPKPFSTLLAAAILFIATAACAAGSKPVDDTIYAGLLHRYVDHGRVDYAGFKKEEARLDAYLDQMARVVPGNLERSQQMAFYINLYNAATIKLILTGYPGVKSIKDLGSLFESPWKKKIVRLDGRTVTLDHIENDILRARFKDPRIHFAINCASKSCPPLAPEPYSGATLDAQLNKAAAAFINNPRSNYLQGGILYVSHIFKWFAEDFHDDVIGFFKKYAAGRLKEALDQARQPLEVKYLEYDWSLNGA